MVTTMKKKQLEMFLQKIPDFNQPKPSFEQYQTPATIAADILFYAYQNHDILNKTVVDLGCGTGMFTVGSKVLNAKHVIGIDIDVDCISLAESFAQKHHLDITFLVQDILKSDFSADTVIMNPPFGAQKANQHADRVFLEKAIRNASVVYSLHLTKTVPFLTKMIRSFNATIDDRFKISFPLKGQFTFHKKLMGRVSVSCLRIIHLPAEE
ncbi:MAG: methyltransferase [Candidatus Thermoplasmatota archaeon]|nr:methyltransferase [Candidatus Thermoplasmatota archaeon]